MFCSDDFRLIRCACLLLGLTCIISKIVHRPYILSSSEFSLHRSSSFHPECPERIDVCLPAMEILAKADQIKFAEISLNSQARNLALTVIEKTHSNQYVDLVRKNCEMGLNRISPWDEDTYINKFTFNQTILAQYAWIKGVDHVMERKTMSFSLTRPPGHHASYEESHGFCVFNFAVGAALYAIEHHHVERVGILDFDVHYGNGIADLVKSNPKIRYSSIHELGIFPMGRGGTEETGDFNNILNCPVKYGSKFAAYELLLREKAIPFIKSFDPQLVIIW